MADMTPQPQVYPGSGRVWPSKSENPKAPPFSGKVTLLDGSEARIVLWHPRIGDGYQVKIEPIPAGVPLQQSRPAAGHETRPQGGYSTRSAPAGGSEPLGSGELDDDVPF